MQNEPSQARNFKRSADAEQFYTKEINKSLRLATPIKTITGEQLTSCFSVSELAGSCIGAVGSAIADLVQVAGLSQGVPNVAVNQRLASLWFTRSIYPLNWKLPPIWDTIAGDYQACDGWVKLHTNLPHHKDAALRVLGVRESREAVAAAVLSWNPTELESEIVKEGGVAAVMRSKQEWACHPQGLALASEPLINWGEYRLGTMNFLPVSSVRPLKGLRVLDLTRVLAGPVATRTLAGFGAEVLRIDPPSWDEPFVVPDITLGKRCATLDLERTEDRSRFEALIECADVLIHGYRPGALERLGYGRMARLKRWPNLIDVSLNAYGWSGPWADRRGFDSLVQMSNGIANAGMNWSKSAKPTPLPVQALDHASGYLMAAAVISIIKNVLVNGELANARLSLARTAELMVENSQPAPSTFDFEPVPSEFSTQLESTPWGLANRLSPALNVEGSPMQWSRAANNLGSSSARWLDT